MNSIQSLFHVRGQHVFTWEGKGGPSGGAAGERESQGPILGGSELPFYVVRLVFVSSSRSFEQDGPFSQPISAMSLWT